MGDDLERHNRGGKALVEPYLEVMCDKLEGEGRERGYRRMQCHPCGCGKTVAGNLSTTDGRRKGTTMAEEGLHR